MATHPAGLVGGRLGLLPGIALYLASVLGTGLLVLPGLAAQTAGPASILSVAAVTLLAIPLAGAFAALAARHPDPGGVAAYARRTLGPTAARAAGYWFMFGVAAGGCVVALLGARYVATVLGIDEAAVPVIALGWEVGTHISGEFRRPRRTIPIATTVTLVLSGAGYLVLQIVTVGALGPRAGEGDVVLLDLARAGDLPGAPMLIGAAAGIVALGVMNVYLAAFAKLGASLASAGDLPGWFAKGVENGRVPRRALLLTGFVVMLYFCAALATGGQLQPFILIHTASMVAIYVIGMIAAVRLLPRGTAGHRFAVVAVVLTTLLLPLAGIALVVPLLLAAAAVVVSVVRRRRGA
ncbi:amino acid permease [Microbacterium bovistercoris]|uniref:Amino acid permease n=1 Tax=Microbacterium bovistercoris TaxID=2293570 RepID=A0A371NVL0_9MICO|nr:amino acid permease [Microbacterium bovistercoris]